MSGVIDDTRIASLVFWKSKQLVTPACQFADLPENGRYLVKNLTLRK